MRRTSRRPRARAGFSLAELIIALSLTAVIGAAVTTLFVTQSRFFDAQQKLGGARELSRSALNVALAEMRMIDRDNGVVAATPTSVTMRVPFAMGIVCAASGSAVTAVLAPVPDVIFQNRLESYGGYMVRPLHNPADSGRFTRVTGSSVGSGSASNCTSAGIQPDSVSPVRLVRQLTPGVAAQPGWPIVLYSNVTYSFAPAAGFDDRLALLRTAGAVTDTLVAPFAGTARFRFHHGAMDGTAADAPPADLALLDGIELVLDGLSERPGPGGEHTTVALRTSVFFQNRRN